MMKSFSEHSRKLAGECIRFPSGYVACKNYGNCTRCDLANRIREDRACSAEIPLFTWRDCLAQTPSGGGENWYQKPVVLSSEVMERKKIKTDLLYQIMICVDGPGCFKKNTAGEIDGYLLCDPTVRLTVTRLECYGIPNPRAAERYDHYFFYGLSRLVKR